MRNFFRKFHLWVSVPFGIVITITCFTGALLMFEDEITALCRDDVTSVSPAGAPLPLNELARKVDATLPADVDVKGVVVSSSPDEAYKVNLSKPKKAAVYVNQYTGEVIGKDERLPFFQTVFRLHRWLMDSDPGDGKVFWGRIIVGTSTLAFVVILISGLVIWWPRNRKMLKNRLQIVAKKGKNRFWHDLHVAGGFYALLLLLAMALTGLTWSFEWYRNGVYGMLGVGDGKNTTVVVAKNNESNSIETVPQECLGSCSTCALPVCVRNGNGATVTTGQGGMAKRNADAVSGATSVETQQQLSGYDAWQAALDNVKTRVSQYETITVSAGTVSVVQGGCGNVRAADKYSVDEDGEITSAQLYKDTPAKSKVGGWIYSLHIGAWAGWVGRILAFLAALLGATLPITGYYFWIRRLYGKRKSKR